MPNSIKNEQSVVINPERETAVQTALTGNTVYSLPRWTAKQNVVDVMLMIMDDDGPLPMLDMKPAKKTPNAADQFCEDHHGEYEAMGQSQSQIERVHNHNNACPKMYDELDKRRSIARVGMAGSPTCQTAMSGTPPPSSENMTAKFDPTCLKCIKRKKRIERERQQQRRRTLCRKCREQLSQKESKNNLGRVSKQKISKPRTQQTRCRSFSRTFKACIIRSNKGFQCVLTAETKSVSTSTSSDHLLSEVRQDITTPNIDIFSVKEKEKIVLKSKSSHKKRVGKKSASVKSDMNNSGLPDTETTSQARSSYNSFMSAEHEPMIE